MINPEKVSRMNIGLSNEIVVSPEEHRRREQQQMPLHFNDLDVVSDVVGLRSALIVSCNMCPAVAVAVREHKPSMQFFRSLLKSPPFHQYIRVLQSKLAEKGVDAKVFKSNLHHQ